MNLTAMFPNHLATQRAAKGLSLEEVATRAGLEPRVYAEMEAGRLLPEYHESLQLSDAIGVDLTVLFNFGILNTIGDSRFFVDNADYKRFYDSMEEAARLLIFPDEMTWFDRQTMPDREVDVVLNLSCSTQVVPHLMLDIVAIFEVLGVDFAAGASRQFCCGTYYRRTGKLEATNKQNAAVGRRVLAWGAPTIVHTCTQCTNTFGDIQRRRTLTEGLDEPVDHIEHTDYLRFIDERLTELGDKVPWKKEVNSKILIHGHPTYSWIEERAKRDVAKIAKHIPGVEVVGMLDRISIDSFCSTQPGDQVYERPKTREGVAFFRDELATQAELWGADTISPSHHHCLTIWTPYASSRVDVRSVVSQLAEALGVGHPDRYKAACQLGTIEEIVAQTRPMWSAWKMSEQKAFETARAVFDPNWSTVGHCACGRSDAERCGHDSLIGVEILTGRREATPLP